MALPFTFKNLIGLSLLFSVITLNIDCTGCSYHFPQSSDIPPGARLPIDGFWGIKNPMAKDGIVRIEGGRIIFEKGGWDALLKKGDVICKDLQKTGEDIYTGSFYYSDGTTGQGKIKVWDDKLILTTPSKVGVDIDIEYYLDSIFDRDMYERAHKMNFTIENITFSDALEKSDEQTQYVDPGSKLTIEKERSIRHTVQLEDGEKSSSTTSTGASANVELPYIKTIQVQLEQSLTREIENRMSRTFETIETFRAKVELDGNISSNWKIIWYDRIKKGIVKCKDRSGKTFTSAFTFPISSEIRAISE